MQIRVLLTGPPRVVLGRPRLELSLPGDSCTRDEFLAALAAAEPRIAAYVADAGAKPASPLRLLLDDHSLEQGAAISDGATVTLLYAVAGGSGWAGPGPENASSWFSGGAGRCPAILREICRDGR